MGLMDVFLPIIFPVFVGIFSTYFHSKKIGLVCSAAIPFLSVLMWILNKEFFTPHTYKCGDGASMWPVAVIFAGGTAAFIGEASFCGSSGFLYLINESIKAPQ